jgi:hypothetical protein
LAIFRIRILVSSLTPGSLFSALETVGWVTPAILAISFTVILIGKASFPDIDDYVYYIVIPCLLHQRRDNGAVVRIMGLSGGFKKGSKGMERAPPKLKPG